MDCLDPVLDVCPNIRDVMKYLKFGKRVNNLVQAISDHLKKPSDGENEN